MKKLRSYLIITLGALLLTAGVYFFKFPNHFTTGGVSALSIIFGFVTDAMDGPYSYFYACGPLPMLRAIERVAQTPGQYSMEERMGCGFGACMGCTIQTRSGPRRVCKDGPVFDRGEVIL